MFCGKCGATLPEQSNFCGKCGIQFERVAQPLDVSQQRTTVQNVNQMHRSTEINTNKLLLTGETADIKSKIVAIVYLLILDIAAIVVGCWALFEFLPSIPRHARDFAPIFQVGGIIAIIGGIFGIGYTIYVAYLGMTERKTKIYVYDDVVKGTVMVGSFGHLQEFNLPYKDIKNVDVVKKTAVVIHTQYEKYICAAKNSHEIRDKIMELVHRERAGV